VTLEFTLSAPTRSRVGATVFIVLRLRNASRRPVDAHFLGRTIVFDIVAARADGSIAWRRLAKGAQPSILQIRTLAPGEALEWRDAWRPHEPGRYRLQGVLPSDEPDPRRTPWMDVTVTP